MDCFGWGSVSFCGQGLGMWLGCGVLTAEVRGVMVDVKVDRSGVLPGPAVTFALGLYDIAAWGRSLVDDGSGDVFILCWGQEQHFLTCVYLL